MILIVGGGIAGLQAAVEVTNYGLEAAIVERSPYLGGNANFLHKYFPSMPLDCSVCITSCIDMPGIRKCFYRSSIFSLENLKIYTNSEIKEVKKDKGKFKVVVEKKPRYVDESRCVNCELCREVCPVEVEDDILGKRKAIYAYPQPVPPVYTIDMNACNKCGKCKEVCRTGAIDFDQKTEEIELEASAIIVSTGFEEFKPYDIVEYGYGTYKNVVTQLELAQMIRQGNFKADKILMIQCVGSRDKRFFGYCSRICCMFAIKHAIMLKEKFPETEIYISYMDIRTPGFYEYWYRRARELGVKFIRSRPGDIVENDGKLEVYFENTLEKRVEKLEVDYVVLSTALKPSENAKKLAKMLNLETDEYGFILSKDGRTNVPNVFVAGLASSVKDVPETVLEAVASTVEVIK